MGELILRRQRGKLLSHQGLQVPRTTLKGTPGFGQGDENSLALFAGLSHVLNARQDLAFSSPPSLSLNF